MWENERERESSCERKGEREKGRKRESPAGAAKQKYNLGSTDAVFFLTVVIVAVVGCVVVV